MFLVGLTGSIGTGKSTVSSIFSDLGVPVIDADKIAREVVVPNTKAWHSIRNHPSFGVPFFTSDGELDREAVAAKVFTDDRSRRILEKIVHPEIRKEMVRQIIRYAFTGRSFVILDVPLLFEKSPLLRFCHNVIVVSCSKQLQFERLRKRSKLNDEEIRQRISAQMPQDEKIRLAGYVVDNSGSLKETHRQVMELYQKLQSSRFHWIVRGVFLTGVLLLFGSIAIVVSFLRWLL